MTSSQDTTANHQSIRFSLRSTASSQLSANPNNRRHTQFKLHEQFQAPQLSKVPRIHPTPRADWAIERATILHSPKWLTRSQRATIESVTSSLGIYSRGNIGIQLQTCLEATGMWCRSQTGFQSNHWTWFWESKVPSVKSKHLFSEQKVIS